MGANKAADVYKRQVLRRTYFNSHVGSLGSRLYEDGKWHSTTTAPQGVKLRLFASLEEGLAAAREDAARRGLKETPPAETATVQSAERISSSSDASQSYHDRLEMCIRDRTYAVPKFP